MYFKHIHCILLFLYKKIRGDIQEDKGEIKDVCLVVYHKTFVLYLPFISLFIFPYLLIKSLQAAQTRYIFA